MIEVRIASQITAQGVSGVRWVLVEAPVSEPAGMAPAPVQAAAPAEAPEQAVSPATASTADGLRLLGLKALIVALGLGAALWTAAVQVGPPGVLVVVPMPQDTPRAPQRAAPVPLHIAPALPAAAEPAASAASSPTDSLPRLTAALR